MERYHACAAALPLERLLRERGELPPDQDNEAASHGRLIHSIAASLMLPDRKDLRVKNDSLPALEEAQQYVDAARELAVRTWGDDEDSQIIVEERMFLTSEDNQRLATGQADVIFLRGTEAIVIDYKTGWNPLQHARDSWQLKLYAAMTYQRFGCISIRVAYIHRGEFHSEEIIDKSDLEMLATLVFPGMVSEIDQNPFRQNFSPGEDVCKYCACKLKCPALNAQYMLMEPKATVDDTFLPALSNYQLEEMKDALDALAGFQKSLEAEMKTRAQEDEFAFVSYEMAPGRNRRTIEDAGVMCEALAGAGAELSDIYKAVKIGVGDAEKIHKKMTGLKGAVAKADFLDRFGEFITKQEGKPGLRKRKDA